MAQHGSGIFWHETVGPRAPSPPATGRLRCDVVIVGAGFTGLWSAYHLLTTDPTLDIVLLDAHHAGFGASGRNAGFAMTLLDLTLHRFATTYGDDASAHAHRAVARSVVEIAEAVTAAGIDCDLESTGLLRVATNPAQQERLERELATARRLGLDGFDLLDRDGVRAQVDSPAYVGGLLEESCALVNPAKLSVGLADTVRDQGARSFEGSPVTDVVEEPGGVLVTTALAQVRADRAILATNAWVGRLPGLTRRVLPVYTYVVLTEPLSDRQWASIGWAGRQGIEDARNLVHYYRPTADGRILLGGADVVYRLGGAVSPRRDRHERIRRRLERDLLATFPQLGRVRFTHHWGGPIAVSGSLVPLVGTLGGGRVCHAVGYSGHGVAPAHTAGRVLRDLVLDRDTDDTAICFVGRRQPTFPPEPLSWVGAELSRRELLFGDRRMDAGHPGGDPDPIVFRLLDRFG